MKWKTLAVTAMGDGELAEGSVWEAAMAAAHYRLDNLTVFVDRNHLQISGDTEKVMSQDSLQERWGAFGWNTITINGNKIGEISRAIEIAQKNSENPTIIIANTTKGCGCPSIENKAEWHHKLPTLAEYKTLLAEIRAGGVSHGRNGSRSTKDSVVNCNKPIIFINLYFAITIGGNFGTVIISACYITGMVGRIEDFADEIFFTFSHFFQYTLPSSSTGSYIIVGGFGVLKCFFISGFFHVSPLTM